LYSIPSSFLWKVNIKELDMPLLDTRATDDNLDNRFIADLVLQILSYVAQKKEIISNEGKHKALQMQKHRVRYLGGLE